MNVSTSDGKNRQGIKMLHLPQWASSRPFSQSRTPSQILDLSTHEPIAPSAWQNSFPTQSSSASKQSIIRSINLSCNKYINNRSIDKQSIILISLTRWSFKMTLLVGTLRSWDIFESVIGNLLHSANVIANANKNHCMTNLKRACTIIFINYFVNN